MLRLHKFFIICVGNQNVCIKFQPFCKLELLNNYWIMSPTLFTWAPPTQGEFFFIRQLINLVNLDLTSGFFIRSIWPQVKAVSIMVDTCTDIPVHVHVCMYVICNSVLSAIASLLKVSIVFLAQSWCLVKACTVYSCTYGVAIKVLNYYQVHVFDTTLPEIIVQL